jgi:uncharacterized protein
VSVGIWSSVHEPLAPGVGGLVKYRHGGIGAQSESQRLQPECITGGNIGQVDVAAEMPDEPRLLVLSRCLEDDLMGLNNSEESIDHVGSDPAIGSEDTNGAALTPFRQHPRGPGIKVGLSEVRPLVGSEDRFGVFRPDFGDDDGMAAGLGDEHGLVGRIESTEPVGYFDARKADVCHPSEAFDGSALQRGDLKQGSSRAGHDGVLHEQIEFGAQLRVEIRAAPTHLPDVYGCSAGSKNGCCLVDRDATIDHQSEASESRLRRTRRQVKEARLRHTSYGKRSSTIVQRMRTYDGTLSDLVRRLRTSSGWTSKSEISLVRDVFGPGDWRSGPGDDGAVVRIGSESAVVCGEALLPAFVEHDPYGAGIAAVLCNVNDVAAMGGIPDAIVDTLVGDRDTCRQALEGMRYASMLYDVPIVGGHLTINPTAKSLSAFALGHCPGPALSADAVRPGQQLGLLVFLEGEMRTDFPFFRSFNERGTELAGDVRLLAELATEGSVVAAKDVSMAGLLGSLAMLLEPTRTGVTINLADIPVPEGVDFERWLISFPCYAFLVCSPTDRVDEVIASATKRGLTYASLGQLNDSGRLNVCEGDQTVTVVDLQIEEVIGLRPN